MKHLVFTADAERDLTEILEFIAIHRPSTAIEVVGRLRARCELLGQHPLLGQRRPDMGANHRSFPAERWIIIYRDLEDRVEIDRIVDGSRDLEGLF